MREVAHLSAKTNINPRNAKCCKRKEATPIDGPKQTVCTYTHALAQSDRAHVCWSPSHGNAGSRLRRSIPANIPKPSEQWVHEHEAQGRMQADARPEPQARLTSNNGRECNGPPHAKASKGCLLIMGIGV